jgi:Tol biopolymer transport system component
MVQALVAGAAPKEIRPNGPIHSPKWSVDGKSIFYLHGYEPGVIHRVRLDGTPADPLPGHRPSGWLTVAKAANGGMRIVYPEGNLAFRVNRLRLPSPTSDEPPQSSPTVLVESTRQDVEPRVSPDGQQIVFVSNRSGPFELWLTNRNGAPAQQLTFLNATGMGKPSWSPEGKSIAFCARVGDAPRIYVLTLIDRSVRAVAEGGEGPSWTPDGSYLYFAKHLGARLTIWRIAREQKNAEPLTDQGGMGPTVSPDSKWIYYVHDLKLWRRALNGGDAEVVAPGFGSGSYEIRNDWVYYLEYDPKQTGRKRLPVRALNLITRQAKTLGWVDEPIGDGFAVDPKGQFLYYSFRTRKETDLMQSTVPQ